MAIETVGDNTTDDWSGTIDGRGREVAPTTNYGSDASINLGKFDAGNWDNGFIAFTGLSNISSSATVNSASISMYQSFHFEGVVTHDFTFRRMLRDWVESESTWNIYSTGNNYQTAGGTGNLDRDNTNSAGDMPADQVLEYKTLATNAQLVSEIEDFIDGTLSNYGHHIERTDGQNDETFKSFVTSEGADGQRPFITVDFTVSAGNDLTSVDGLELSDSVSLTAAASMSMSDTVVLSETFNSAATALMNLSDGFAFSDTAQNTAALLMALSDTAIFSDSVSLQAGNFMNLSDGFDVSDSLSVDAGVITMTLNDGVTFSDAFNQVAAAIMSLDDGVVLSDLASLNTGELIEGPIKISVRVKQTAFDIVIKQPTFNIEVN